MVGDSAAWADNPAAVAAMRRMLTADPMPMARALSLMEDEADDVAPTAYAVAGAVGSAATVGASSTALLCYAVDPDLVGDDRVSADGADGVDQRADPVVVLADHHDGAHVLAGEAWLVLPTWQLAATGSVSTAPQPDTPAPIRIDIWAGSLAGEACLILPTCQIVATCIASAAPQPPVGGVRVLRQTVCSDKPAGRVHEQPTMPTPIRGDQDEPTERVTRERDADYAASLWDEERGEFVKLPPATQPSRQAQAKSAVHDALTNLARVSSKQPIRSP